MIARSFVLLVSVLILSGPPAAAQTTSNAAGDAGSTPHTVSAVSQTAGPVQLNTGNGSTGYKDIVFPPSSVSGVPVGDHAADNQQQSDKSATELLGKQEGKHAVADPNAGSDAYSDSLDKYDFIVPEVTQTVIFSSIDVNRIVCQGAIRDIVDSKEKNVTVTYVRNNAFIKFLYAIINGKEAYPTKPVEFFVPCDGDIYHIIAVPRRVPSQTIRLGSGKLKKIQDNNSLFGGMPIEKKVMQFIKYAYTDSIPESIEVIKSHQRFRIFSDLALTLEKTATVDGEGLLLKEFIATNATEGVLRLDERQFLLTDLTSRTLAVSISKPVLSKGESSKIFIVETTGGEQSGRP